MSECLDLVVKAAVEKLAEDVVVLDFTGHSALLDYFVIVSATNEPMASSIVDHVMEVATKQGLNLKNAKASWGSKWMLVDLVDVILHVFVGEERQLYQLEKLWGDLPRVEVKL